MKFTLIVLTVALAAGCTSPEATRVRGGGPGADVGNRRGPVEMHAGSKPYWETPKLITPQNPPLDTARHASSGTNR